MLRSLICCNFALVMVVAARTGTPTLAADCNQKGYSTVTSGSGTTIGTGAWTTTWPSGYSIHDNGVNFSDEGQWIDNATNNSQSLEGGFYSGAGSNVVWTDGILPYYTTNDGNNETDDSGNYLQYNNVIWMQTTAPYGPDDAYVQVGDHIMHPGDPSIPTPRQNYAQGEVSDVCDYPVLMGGSSSSPGEQFTEKYEATDTSFSNWGYYTHSTQSGYGYSGDNINTWHNWGGQNT